MPLACPAFLTPVRPRWWRAIPLLFSFLALGYGAPAQIYPVQVTAHLVPPYSVHLEDYVSSDNDRLRVILLQRDLTQPSYMLRLSMSIEWNGQVILSTSPSFRPSPITVMPGIPTVISGPALAPYLDPRHLDFTGLDRNQYERTRTLPEGSYTITFTAYDYRRQDIQVSNRGSAHAYLYKAEPPLINLPACGSAVPPSPNPFVLFSWMPRHVSSPNSATSTEYELSLYENRVPGRSPNIVVSTALPIFQARTKQTQYLYGPDAPMLTQGLSYVWRVQAIDLNSTDAFRNEGFSETCSFTYGAQEGMGLKPITGLTAKGIAQRKGRAMWDSLSVDQYKAHYRKTGPGHHWFSATSKNNTIDLTGLEPGTEYEVRVQGIKGNITGPYSELVKFNTLEKPVPHCGENAQLTTPIARNPLESALPGMDINARGLEMVLTEVSSAGPPGWYKGLGRVNVPYLGGATFMARFEKLFIDRDYNVVLGRIDLLSHTVAQMATQQLAWQQERATRRLQEENQQAWEGVDFYEKTLLVEGYVIESIDVDNQGAITLSDDKGKKHTVPEITALLANAPGKAVIVQDKDGHQFVVQKKEDGTVVATRVEGGGLPPSNSIAVTKEDLDLLTLALNLLKGEYTSAKTEGLKQDYYRNKAALIQFKEEVKKEWVSGPVPSFTGNPEDEAIVVMEESISMGTDEFSKLSQAFKGSERDYNIAKVVALFTKTTNGKEEHKVIIQSLRIEGLSFGDYVGKRETEGIGRDAIAEEIKKALVALIGQVLDNKQSMEP